MSYNAMPLGKVTDLREKIGALVDWIIFTGHEVVTTNNCSPRASCCDAGDSFYSLRSMLNLSVQLYKTMMIIWDIKPLAPPITHSFFTSQSILPKRENYYFELDGNSS